MNYGLSGTGPSQQLEILKSRVKLDNVKMLIDFIFLENDLNDGDPQNFKITNRPKVYINYENYEVIKPISKTFKENVRDFLGDYELYVYVKKTFYFYHNIILNLFNKKEETKIVKLDNKKCSISNEKYKWKQLKGAIYQIKKISIQNSIDYKIVIFSTSELDGRTENREKLEVFLNSEKIEYLNIVPFLEKLSHKQTINFQCDSHWNGNTHENIAKYLKEKFKL